MSWLLKILGSVFQAIIGGFVDDARNRRAEDAQRQAGRQEQKAVDQAATIEAQQRMQDAAARPADAQKDLDRGTF